MDVLKIIKRVGCPTKFSKNRSRSAANTEAAKTNVAAVRSLGANRIVSSTDGRAYETAHLYGESIGLHISTKPCDYVNWNTETGTAGK
jgi:hypothetical protein